MSTAVTFLISFTVVLFAVFTAFGGMFTVLGTTGETQKWHLGYIYAVSRSDVVAVAATSTTSGGHTDVDVTLANRGELSYALFSEWDVNVHYTDAEGTERSVWLPYSASLSDGKWTVAQLYLDADAAIPEVLEPGLLNPEEEALFRLRLAPSALAGTAGWVVITPPEGSSSSISFSNPM